MQKELRPGVVIATIVCALVLAGLLLFRAATEKPPYPGMNAGKPSAERAGSPLDKPPPGHPFRR